ncbi:MAG: hypothetical protein PHP65_02040 [Bacilli bacterium]|nr:hypothetical protein [Bacilli bacterium]
MKKIVFFVFLALFLSGCDTKQPSAEQLASQLESQLTFPEIATEDLIFPSTFILDTHEVALTWHSDNPNAIDSSGFVYPQASLQEVGISATLTYNGSSHIVDFGIIQVPAWNKSALNIPTSTSTKLNFPQATLLDGRLVNLVWHSDNDEVIAANGDVFPSITPRTSRVWAQILYKDTISILDFGLVQVVSWSNEEIKSYLTELILLPDSTKEHIDLPEELAVDSVSVLLTWTSSHPNVIANDGTVTPSSQNVDVTLHLQASFQEQTLDFDFKTITVLANTPAEHLQFVKTKINVPEETKTNITLEKSVDGVAINWFSTHPNILNN